MARRAREGRDGDLEERLHGLLWGAAKYKTLFTWFFPNVKQSTRLNCLVILNPTTPNCIPTTNCTSALLTRLPVQVICSNTHTTSIRPFANAKYNWVRPSGLVLDVMARDVSVRFGEPF